MDENVAQDAAFVTVSARSGAGDDDALRVDHHAPYAAGVPRVCSLICPYLLGFKCRHGAAHSSGHVALSWGVSLPQGTAGDPAQNHSSRGGCGRGACFADVAQLGI